MAPAVERREHTRGGKQLDRSISPVTNRRSPRQRSSPHRERLPGRQRSSSPSRRRSPQRNSTAYRRPFENDKLRDQAVQPKRERGRSPTSSSSSLSPPSHTKRTRKAQTERESEKVTSREDWRISREERKKGTAREFREKERTSSSPSPSPRTKRLMRVQTERESEKVTSRGDGKINRDERRKGSEREVKEKERSASSRSLSPSTKRLIRVQTDREAEKVTNKEDERNSRDEHKKGRERENRDQERTTNSRSPSPRTKRLMRAQAEHEVEKVKDRERGRNTTKEVRDKGRTGEHGDAEDILNERRSTRDSKEGGSSRSSKRDRDHDRSFSPKERSGRMRHGSRSRSPSRMSRAHAREEVSNSRGDEQSRESDIDSIARMKAAEESLEAKEKDKQKPSFELSGKLAEETNRVRGVTLLFNEPADARKPDVRWRLYVFKGGEVLNEPLYVHRQSCYLFGRERRVADIPTDHPSCSKQHAVIQYRLVEKEKPDGLMLKQSGVCHFARELGQLSFLAYSRVRNPVKLLHFLFYRSPFLLLAKSTNSSCVFPCIYAHLVLCMIEDLMPVTCLAEYMELMAFPSFLTCELLCCYFFLGLACSYQAFQIKIGRLSNYVNQIFYL